MKPFEIIITGVFSLALLILSGVQVSSEIREVRRNQKYLEIEHHDELIRNCVRDESVKNANQGLLRSPLETVSECMDF